jgi:hypothetical protein
MYSCTSLVSGKLLTLWTKIQRRSGYSQNSFIGTLVITAGLIGSEHEMKSCREGHRFNSTCTSGKSFLQAARVQIMEGTLPIAHLHIKRTNDGKSLPVLN